MHPFSQAVLQNMGLTLVEPRFDFPAAKKASLLWQTQSATAVQTIAEIPDSTSFVDSLNLFTEPVVAVNESIKESVQWRFRFRIVRIEHWLMVLEQPRLQWQEEAACLHFFSDIFFALHQRLPAQINHTVFDWPPSSSYPHAQDKLHTQHTLQHFIAQDCANNTTAQVFLWGAGAQYLTDSPLALGQAIQVANLRIIQLRDVSAYWQQGLLKRELWQQLQAIFSGD